MQHDERKQEVDQFLRDYIDTVPHLESLLLLWNSRPKTWSVPEMAKALFISDESAQSIMDDLAREHLIAAVRDSDTVYLYEPERDQLIAAVESTYRRELIRISRLIHSKASAAVRQFARAFQIKKDRE